MTDPNGSGGGLDERRRRARFRAWHRGTREADLLLGRFAEANIERMNDQDLTDFEALLGVPDADVVAWITGRAATDPRFAVPVLEAIIRFHSEHPGDD
jgi:antitoxin CptB